MKLDNFYNHLEHLDICSSVYCYITNILANASFNLLQVLLVELRAYMELRGSQVLQDTLEEGQNMNITVKDEDTTFYFFPLKRKS